ncbi:MAG: hypothetical protein R8G34_02255 [Paracoccaceae bacterium]|nr:hypothetical protein [Paracoccaceae bacterium]
MLKKVPVAHNSPLNNSIIGGRDLDKVSRDVLDETKSVLCELVGYLAAVEQNQGGRAHPILGELATRLDQVVRDIETLDQRAHFPQRS